MRLGTLSSRGLEYVYPNKITDMFIIIRPHDDIFNYYLYRRNGPLRRLVIAYSNRRGRCAFGLPKASSKCNRGSEQFIR